MPLAQGPQFVPGPNLTILVAVAAFWLVGLVGYIILVRFFPMVSRIGFSLGIIICVMPIVGHLAGFPPLDSTGELLAVLLVWLPITVPLFLSPLIAYTRRRPEKD